VATLEDFLTSIDEPVAPSAEAGRAGVRLGQVAAVVGHLSGLSRATAA
jgi:hypothetical protein